MRVRGKVGIARLSLANGRRAGHARVRRTAQINPLDIRRYRCHRPTAAAATPAAFTNTVD